MSKKEPKTSKVAPQSDIASQQLQFAWWALLFYLTLGLVLEMMHGFKIGWYLDVPNQPRRLMFTLGHAHGTLLALINLGFALSLRVFQPKASLTTASRCLKGALVLMPMGFIYGGLFTYDGDPGLGVVMVPIGAVLLFAGVFATARNLRDPSPEP